MVWLWLWKWSGHEKMIWWWELGCKDVWTPDSVIKFGCEVNIRSIHEEVSNICVSSLITWCKANCDDIFSIALPSLVVMPFLHQLLDFVLKSPRSTIKKGLFCTAESRFSSRGSLKDSNWSCDWLGDLNNAMKLKVYHLPLAQSSHTRWNNWYR